MERDECDLEDFPCPEGHTMLTHEDTFGNQDHAMGKGGRKAGDIYFCFECDSSCYTFDDEPGSQVHAGYPC